jgi:N-acetylmuramoyl-L-alanine amidase
LGDRTLTRVLGLKIGRIVLDPGHGGHDLGTIGPGGLFEKDLVLSIARRLQKMLRENLGAEVVLTRSDDTFISLEERTEIANQHHADLFISIHANSSRIRSISGVETYFLDFARTKAEREVAARENATTMNNIRDLEDLIKKIAQADKSLESRELASIIQEKLYAGSRQFSRGTQNRGVRSAPFVVLIGANMPSVLAEVAFISNPKDERLLSKEANQNLLVKALFSGIEGYMKTLGSDVVNNQTSSR